MNKTVLSIAAAAALLLSSGAFAQGYAGLGAGTTKLNFDCTGTTTCDTSSSGWKLFGGYKFSPNWGAELNYFDFGKLTGTLDTGGGILSIDLKGTGFGAGVAFFGDFAPSWRGVARLGVASTKAVARGNLGGTVATDRETSTNAYYGVGVSYLISKNLSIDGAWDASKVKQGGESASARLLSIGLTYGF